MLVVIGDGDVWSFCCGMCTIEIRHSIVLSVYRVR